MFNFNKKFIKKFIFISWIFLQLNANLYCHGYFYQPARIHDVNGGSAIITLQHGKLPNATTIFNEPQIVQYEDTVNENHHRSHAATSGLLRKCDPCPDGILCVPQIQCPAHVRLRGHDKPQVCDLAGGKFGFCCITGQNHTGGHLPKERLPLIRFIAPHIVEEARLKFDHLMHAIAMAPIRPGRPDFTHNFVFHSSVQEDVQNFHLTNSAMEQVITTQMLSEQEQIPIDDIITNNIEFEFKETPLAHNCEPPRHCSLPNAKYRTLDGSCNNPHSPRWHWGSAGQPMERLLPPAYEDGIWTPRQRSTDGTLLASARKISQILMTDADRPHEKYNLMLMQFGQYLAHDVMQSAAVRLENGDIVQCCTPNNDAALSPEQRHFACFPIEIDPNDEFYSIFRVRCMNFVRLSLAPNTECRASYGKQRNKVSHFIDASPVYGSNVAKTRELRAFKGGKLRMFSDFSRQLLPLTDEQNACDMDASGRVCFKSGDGRTNQIISLIALHILFAREHNRVADILAQRNPRASDELLFQEARRIVIAELQHIVYNEYLPIIIGSVQMERFRLKTQQQGGYSSDYNAEINPGITNEFSGAAFRMGHSSVDGRFHMQQEQGKFDEIIQIPDVMFNPSRMRKRTFFDDILRTMLVQPMQKVDSAITHGLTRFLFRGHNPFGLDLAAINIQRGRDHGLRCYNDYLEVMGNRKIESFSQMPEEVGRQLSRVYRSPDDIDLWVGGLLEKPVDGGIVGSTFSEIIADQFSRLKQGDRYYYEYSKSINPGAFRLDQLQEIRKTTMARIICDNADHLTLAAVPPLAFVRADFTGNQPVRCDSHRIPKVDLKAWRF